MFHKIVFSLTNRQHFAVVCSVIDTRYDVIMYMV